MQYYKLLPDLPIPPVELIEKIDMIYRPTIDLFEPEKADYLAIDRRDDGGPG